MLGTSILNEIRLFSHWRKATAELGNRSSKPYVRNSVKGAVCGVAAMCNTSFVESYWKLPQPSDLVLKIQVQGPSRSSSTNSAYVPALSTLPSSWTSCEKLMVVVSFAPARQGVALTGPKPSSKRPYLTSSPQMCPVRSFVGGKCTRGLW